MNDDHVTDEYALRAYLNDLRAPEVRDLAAGMVYRHESTKAEIIDFLVRYMPAQVREHRADAMAAAGIHVTDTTPAPAPAEKPAVVPVRFNGPAYLAHTADDRERMRNAARGSAERAATAYCNIIAAEAAEIIRGILPTAKYLEFTADPDVIGLTVTILKITDADERLLYDGDTFTTTDVAGGYNNGDEWTDESDLRDKLVDILDFADWYFYDDPSESPLFLNLAHLGFTAPKAEQA